MKRYISCIYLLFFPLLVFAEQTKIVGTVFNEQLIPLSNVIVVQDQTNNVCFTNARGEYHLFVNSHQDIKIIFSLIGYQEKEFNLTLSNDSVELNVMLLSSNELAPVIVEGKQRQNSSFDRLNPQSAKFLPNASGGSIESLISTFGGVSSTNELSSQYSVRGGSFDENIIYVNGVEIHRPLLIRSGQQEGLSFINSEMVQSVDFSAGGYGAEYGDKMSSVLDIQYKTPKKFEASAGGSFLGGNAHIGSKTGKFSQITGVRYKTNKSLLKTTDTDAEYDPSFLDAQTFINFDFSSKWNLSFLGNYSHNVYKFTPETRETKFGTLSMPRDFKVYFNGWEKDKFVNYNAALNLKGKIGNVELGITGALFSSDEIERYDIEGQYRLTEMLADESSGQLLGVGKYREHARNKMNADIYNISFTGKLLTQWNTLKWGISFQKEKVKDKIKEWEMRDSTGYSLPNDGQMVNVYSNLKSDNKIEPERYSGYIQDTYKLNTDAGLFYVNAGIRASYWTYNDEFIVSPRGSIAFIPAAIDQFTIRLASGIYYQAPLYKEIQQIKNQGGNNIIELNKDIKSPKSIHFVLGTDFYFNWQMRQFKFTTEAYYKKLSDLIPYTVNNVKIRYAGENQAKGYSMGLDMKLYGEFVPGVDSWLSFSLMKTQQNINGVKVPLPTDQSYNISLFFQDYMPGYERLKMNLIASFSQGLPVSAPYKSYEEGYFRTPAYKHIDLGFSWQILGEKFDIRNRNSFCRAFKNIWLGLDIFNLFDISNTNTYYWITDVHNDQYAVPNYLTGRQINLKLAVDF